MATDREYMEFILDQLSGLDGLSCRPMMGEYILYLGGRIVGGVYDDRLLVKPTASARRLLPDAPLELPYEGAKEMLLVDSVDDREFLRELLAAVAEELPAAKGKTGPAREPARRDGHA